MDWAIKALNLATKCQVVRSLKHVFFCGRSRIFQFIFYGLKTFSIVYHKLTPDGRNCRENAFLLESRDKANKQGTLNSGSRVKEGFLCLGSVFTLKSENAKTAKLISLFIV